jgi:nucleoside-diphosphate kinase
MKERTLVLIQRDAVARNLIGEIISRFEKGGLKIVAMKSVWPTREMAEKHYRTTDEQTIGIGNKTMRGMRERGNEKEIKKLYGSEDAKEIGTQVVEILRQFLTKGMLIALVLEGENAIERVRKIVGYTDPAKAEKGTIRGDLGTDYIAKSSMEKRKLENLVHAADSPEAAKREIDVWFKKEELK